MIALSAPKESRWTTPAPVASKARRPVPLAGPIIRNDPERAGWQVPFGPVVGTRQVKRRNVHAFASAALR